MDSVGVHTPQEMAYASLYHGVQAVSLAEGWRQPRPASERPRDLLSEVSERWGLAQLRWERCRLHWEDERWWSGTRATTSLVFTKCPEWSRPRHDGERSCLWETPRECSFARDEPDGATDLSGGRSVGRSSCRERAAEEEVLRGNRSEAHGSSYKAPLSSPWIIPGGVAWARTSLRELRPKGEAERFLPALGDADSWRESSSIQSKSDDLRDSTSSRRRTDAVEECLSGPPAAEPECRWEPSCAEVALLADSDTGKLRASQPWLPLKRVLSESTLVPGPRGGTLSGTADGTGTDSEEVGTPTWVSKRFNSPTLPRLTIAMLKCS